MNNLFMLQELMENRNSVKSSRGIYLFTVTSWQHPRAKGLKGTRNTEYKYLYIGNCIRQC